MNQYQTRQATAFDQQQYYLLDETVPVKQSHIDSETQMSNHQTKQLYSHRKHEADYDQQRYYQQQQQFQPEQTVIQQAPLTKVPPQTQPQQQQEHLYVNQKQLFMQQQQPDFVFQQQQHREQQHYESPEHYQQDPYDKGTREPVGKSYQQPPSQHYLHYGPKPFKQQQVPPKLQRPSVPQASSRPLQQAAQTKSQLKQPQTYNRNHWLVQEAELRRQLSNQQNVSRPSGITASSQADTKPMKPAVKSEYKPPPAPPKGMLSVSGRKKCSNCGDELGRGCAAMVVESLSLYYHINCFRCSVCHIQLGRFHISDTIN